MNKQNKYKKRTLLLLIITVTALVVCAANLSLKRSIATAGTVLSAPEQAAKSLSDYYTPSHSTSQESDLSEKKTVRKNETSSRPQLHSTAEARRDQYLITVYHGKIGVFDQNSDSTEPVLLRDVNVYLLPEKDIALLRTGIPAAGMQEVKSILEDYS